MKKTAMVTGASEGIGRALAQALAKEGYVVTGVARNEDKLKRLIEELGTDHKYIVADLSLEAGQGLVSKELETGTYNLLINNAGLGAISNFSETPLDQLMAMMNVNCQALVKLSHAFLKVAKNGDALINVSSVLAFMPLHSMSLYCATKAFVTSFSETLWYQYKDKEIYVMGLCPGLTQTSFAEKAGGKSEDYPQSLTETPEQVAQTAMRGLRKRSRPTVISGNKNALFALMPRFLSRKALVNMNAKSMAE